MYSCHDDSGFCISTIQPPRRAIYDMSTDKLESPKVKRIADLITQIQSGHPGEKIIVTSPSVRFLNILGKYLSYTRPELTTESFDGRIKSVERRMEITHRFSSEDGSIDLMLLSASCGGTGLNLHGGSHVIITEKVWSPGLEKQVIERAARLPQEKHVHVYHTHAKSAVDELIGVLVEGKKNTEFPLGSTLRRTTK
ncbi:DNA repair rad5 [Fusarium sporotrichioides]|uniref:DNA repair rad5 n=1 Tax=Fusarium sporotrichioides TaxID=5514 RepID=A0A395RWS9_FUSSP|nr:DNA repair rad5 [Fusarium sporotrichioides]